MAKLSHFGTGALTDTYSYPALSNRLTAIALGAGGTRSFTYDAMGNVTYDNRNGQGYSYTYDQAGRMASFAINGVVQAEYAYNQLGQQIIRRLTLAGTTIHSVYGPDGNRIAEYNEATGALIRQYVWLESAPVAVIEGGVIHFVRSDHIGRPAFATNISATVTWRVSYLPFGGVRTTTGTPPTARFPGQWFQSETGLHQNWMRDYDPTTGRYIQADPLGLVDGASVYNYARLNPGRFVDPWGEQERQFEGLGDLTTGWPNPFVYHDRVLNPRDPGPFHNFPFSYDREIWAAGEACDTGVNPSGPDLNWGYYVCRCVPGTLNYNGRQYVGRYEIGVRNPFFFESPFGLGGYQTTVVHRFFRIGSF